MDVSLPDPKQRILDAATHLFAERGFSAVGVREIAREADVNIAMISYYYDGKLGILKALIEQFFEQYMQIVESADDLERSPEACLQDLIRRIVQFVRTHTELTLVVYNELPLAHPEIADLKAERITQVLQHVNRLFARFGIDPTDLLHISMIGPSFIGTIFFSFRIRPVLERMLQNNGIEPGPYDDAYYEHFTDVISALIIRGIYGAAAFLQQEN